jgi:exodeoxyribonuclease VII large subunit
MVKHLSLFELNSIVSEIISMSLPDSYWVEAELSEAREAYGGHCYMELIEKDERSNTPIAKTHASCWRNRWMLIKPHFERVTGQRIHAGMKVLLKVHAQFHENYGFSWIVDDIDPNYTLGDMARKRQEIIQTLKEEGVFELQKELRLPMFCQRIAVISSASAAGYGDFCNQLADNGYGLQFVTSLFPATMQGEGVEQSVIAALNQINAEWEQWDCVVIIRGGGATSDLSGFDTLALAENVANFPLPIITGIGHERDESVLDMISFRRVKTPTAAAAFLIDHLTEVYVRVMDAQANWAKNLPSPQSVLDSMSSLATSMTMLLPCRLLTSEKCSQCSMATH